MARAPILPSSRADPTGVDRLERGAINELTRRIKRARDVYVEVLNRIPSSPVVNQRYEFRLDPERLMLMLNAAGADVDAILLEGGESGVWFFKGYVEVAARRGVAQQFANLARQSPAYAAGRRSLAEVLSSEPHRRRMALLAAREFEEMKGLSAGVRTTMSRTLTEGMARGKNPRVIAKELTERAGVEISRSRRIARTEVTTALRRARMDEADDAAEQYGLRSKEMHISALSPSTRPTHAARHATLHTTEEQRDWWSRDGNSINCKCSTVSVLVDSSGNPLVPQVVDRAKRTKKVMKAKGRGPWAKEN